MLTGYDMSKDIPIGPNRLPMGGRAGVRGQKRDKRHRRLTNHSGATVKRICKTLSDPVRWSPACFMSVGYRIVTLKGVCVLCHYSK